MAVYVRRGDKAHEMKLVPFADYAMAAEMLWSSGQVPGAGGRSSGIMTIGLMQGLMLSNLGNLICNFTVNRYNGLQF